MARFSNGMEMEYFQEKYCSHCAHFVEDDEGNIGCPVFDAHYAYGDEEQSKPDSPLHMLIVEVEEKPGERGKALPQCLMFIDSIRVLPELSTLKN